MAYPTLAPASRSFTPGDYPIKTYQSQSGVETRILYGSKRTNMTLELSYDNITDTEAQSFATHYDEVKGSYLTFALPSAVRSGWTGAPATIDVVSGAAWRYGEPPSITAVKPGISRVQVKLKGVLS
jgi:hypothetical protein